MHEAHGEEHARQEARKRKYDAFEAMGRTREGVVDMRIRQSDILARGSAWDDLQKRIARAKGKREEDLRRLAGRAVERRQVEGWMRRC